MTAPKPAPPRTAGDVLELLRRHYLPESRPPGGIFAPEIESPCGKRRADLLWMPTTIAGGRGLVGHEIKVSRADVLAELADPTKSDPWARFCTRWWLVVSGPELVDGLAIPEAWGIMAPPSGRLTRSMTVLRPAPLLDPTDLSRGLERLLTWLHVRQHGMEATARLTEHDLRRTIAHRDRTIEQLRAEGLHKLNPHAVRVGKILDRITALNREEDLWAQVDDEAVVRAVLDTGHARYAARAVIAAVDRITAALDDDPFRLARDHMQRLRASVAADPAMKEATQ